MSALAYAQALRATGAGRLAPLLAYPPTRALYARALRVTCAELSRASRDADVWADGCGWYADSNLWARALALDYPLSLVQVAGVASAYSIRQFWDRNVARAESFLATGEHPYGSLRLCTLKARAVVALTRPSLADVQRALRGGDSLEHQKLGEFAGAIYHAGAGEDVACDAIIASGYGFDSGYLTRVVYGPRAGAPFPLYLYDVIAGAIRTAAPLYALTPSQAQAVLWVLWRGGGA